MRSRMKATNTVPWIPEGKGRRWRGFAAQHW